MTDRYHPGEDADDPDLEDVAADRDAPAAAADRLDELTSATSDDSEGIAITDADLDRAACRFCRAFLEDQAANADHDCDGRREFRLEQGLSDEQLAPQTHELGAQLLFTANGLDPYFGIADAFEPDMDPGPFTAAGKTWALNHEEEKVYAKHGKIATRPHDDGDAYRRFNIGLRARDDSEAVVNFLFRVALPNPTHVDTGDPIGGMPTDCPEGVRIKVDSTDIVPDDVLPILRGFADAAGITPDYFTTDALHEWSTATNIAGYVRLRRDLANDHIIGHGGILERLARFGLTRPGEGKLTWKNGVVDGHRNTAEHCRTNLSQFYEDHIVAKRLKCYHLKHPQREATADPTSHPRLEVQWCKNVADTISTVPWQAEDEPDISDVWTDLETWLLSAIHWSGLPISPDPSVYVADHDFALEARSDSIELRPDPMPALEERQQDLAKYHVLREDLSPGERSVLKAIADGGQVHYQTAADEADVAESTVYRTASKLSDIVDRAHGELRLSNEVVADKVSELFAGLEDTAQWIEGQVSKLAREEGYLSEDSTFAKWMRTHGVGIQERRQHVELHGGRYTIDEVRRVLRAGYDAARQAGPNLADKLLDAAVAWTDPDGDWHGPQRAFTIQGNSAIFAVGASTQRDVG